MIAASQSDALKPGGGTVKGNLPDVEPDPLRLHFDMRVRMVFRGAEVASTEGAT